MRCCCALLASGGAPRRQQGAIARPRRLPQHVVLEASHDCRRDATRRDKLAARRDTSHDNSPSR
jgi:hypothetical protein